jgi:hypothetical protein
MPPISVGNGCDGTRIISAITPNFSGHHRQSNASVHGGGCDFPVAPALKSTEAQVFWLPEEDTGSVILTPAPASIAADSTPLQQISPEHGPHVLHELGNGQRLHLALLHDGSTEQPLAAVIPLGIEGFDRIEAVARLLASLHGRAIPPDTRLTRQQLARARRMLQAIDGYRAGATQQEIAEVILRIGKLTRDEWQAASARHVVADLLADARAMIAGGYRKLLRHRRRS